MQRKDSSEKQTYFNDQMYGQVVNQVNLERILDEIKKQGIQDDQFISALKEMEVVRQFVGSPESIMGNAGTKHGEIAEVLEVGVRRAKDALNGNPFSATFDGVSRTSPIDYLINDEAVQSKFINGVNKNLNTVIDHMNKYPGFGGEGSYYHIPKDTYAVIQKIRGGEPIEGLRGATIEKILGKVKEIEERSGSEFGQVVQPGISTYGEVTRGKIGQTLNKHERSIEQKNKEIKDQITKEHQPSIEEGAKAAGTAAVVGGVFSLTTGIMKKHQEGKRFFKGDFTPEDWNEIGIETAKGTLIGGVSGAAIYGMTNYAGLSAPFAGAVVSASKGVGRLLYDHSQGLITQGEVIELGMVICSESAIVGISTAIGQTIIPVPVLGALIGSVAGSMLTNLGGAYSHISTKAIQEEIDAYIGKLDAEYVEQLDRMRNEFNRLGDLTTAAFDFENNLSLLETSITLAQEYGVDEERIITSVQQLDEYILS